MKTSYIVYGASAIIVIALVAILISRSGSKYPSGQTTPVSTGEQANNQVGQTPTAAGLQSVTPISTNNGSVAGVDLSIFGTQANESAAAVSQSDAANAQVISSDGAAINSSTDSVSSPQ